MKDARPLLILLRHGNSAAALRRLLDTFADAEAAWSAGPAAWRQAGLSAASCHAISAADPALTESDLEWLDLPAHHVIGWHSADYPALLRQAAHPPAGLFVRGDPSLLWHPQISVVGSRRPTAGGRDNAQRFARAFGLAGFVVTSGLASGVDTAAHLGAMETSRTIAVLGTGPDCCYPPGNADLMERIAATGALVTEHPPGTPGLRQHFPSRNRLVAGLSLATVVVEAAMQSGALITARLAADAGREVFALPGSIHNPMARGCHRLIRQGAGLAEAPDEIIQALAPMAAALAESLRERLQPASADITLATGHVPAAAPGPAGLECEAGMGPDERLLWSALAHDPVNLDQLCERTGLTVSSLSAMLLTMELDGKTSAAHGRYSRRS